MLILIILNSLYFFNNLCYNIYRFPGSSMVEQEAVNFEVVGSSPIRGAIELK